MFSDRGWILKAAAALGLLAWLCADARRRIAVEHPEIERVALFTEALRGREFHLWARRVHALEPTGFQVNSSVGPMHILSSLRPAVGDRVSVVARATGPRTLEAISVQVNEGFAWKRPLNYVVSILTLIGFLWIVRGRFRWRIHEGVLRSKY